MRSSLKNSLLSLIVLATSLIALAPTNRRDSDLLQQLRSRSRCEARNDYAILR